YRFLAEVSEIKEQPASEPVAISTARSISEPGESPAIPRSDVRVTPHEPAPGRRRLLIAAALVAVAFVAGLSLLRRPRAPGPSEAPRRLAILPFRNLRQDASDDFLSLSLADAVITKLGYVSALVVRPSYSIEKYRDQAVDMRKVGSELNIDTLLTGNFI